MGAEQCRRLADLLQLYAEGESAADERRLVEEHLRQCPECRSTLSCLRRIDAMVAAGPELPASALPLLLGLDEAVLRRVQRLERPLLRPLNRALNLAASVALVLAIGALALALYAAASQLQWKGVPTSGTPAVATETPAPSPTAKAALSPTVEAARRQGGSPVAVAPPASTAASVATPAATPPPISEALATAAAVALPTPEKPKGSLVAYRRTDGVYYQDLDSQEAPRPLVSDLGDYQVFSFRISPLGLQVAVRFSPEEGPLGIAELGGKPRPVAENVREFFWSPDGQWLAYQSYAPDLDSPSGFRSVGIFIVRADLSERRQVAPGNADESLAGWTPDSLELLVFRLTNPGSDDAGERAGGDTYVVPLTGEAPHLLARGLAFRAWSPDGKRALMAPRYGGSLSLVSRDGAQAVLVGAADTTASPHVWLPDGSGFVMHWGNQALLVNAQDGRWRAIVKGVGLVYRPLILTADSSRLLFFREEAPDQLRVVGLDGQGERVVSADVSTSDGLGTGDVEPFGDGGSSVAPTGPYFPPAEPTTLPPAPSPPVAPPYPPPPAFLQPTATPAPSYNPYPSPEAEPVPTVSSKLDRSGIRLLASICGRRPGDTPADSTFSSGWATGGRDEA